MRITHIACALAIQAGLVLLTALPAAAEDVPREWIDADTGHRVVRLSDVPGSLSLYFNYNAFTPQKDKMVYSTPDGIAAIDMATHRNSMIVHGHVRLLFAGRKTRRIYYEVADSKTSESKDIFAVDIDSGKTEHIARIPRGGIQAINADETLLAGVAENAPGIPLGTDGMIKPPPETTAALPKDVRMEQRLAARIPMEIFTISLKTKERHRIVTSTDWLNHLQFSPVDPGLLLYCHEGPWHKVDRLWLVRTDHAPAQPQKVHNRSMAMEIAGHEWFSADGRTVWYDLQTPRGEDFWVAGYDIASGRRTQYHLNRNEWSVHYSSSPDGTLFSGDGGDSRMVAHAPDGKWLYLFRPQAIADRSGNPADASLIQAGAFHAEKLVNMANHNYHLEPNARFSPDGKWLIFRSNLRGGVSHVYAVEVNKAEPSAVH